MSRQLVLLKQAMKDEIFLISRKAGCIRPCVASESDSNDVKDASREHYLGRLTILGLIRFEAVNILIKLHECAYRGRIERTGCHLNGSRKGWTNNLGDVLRLHWDCLAMLGSEAFA